MTKWLRGQEYLLAYTLSAMSRRRGKVLALLAVYALVVFMLASATLYAGALRREATALLAGAPELVVQRLRAGRHELFPAERLDALRALRGVAKVDGRVWGYYFDPAVAANYTLQVPAEDPPPPGQVDIGAGVARARGASPGDLLPFRSATGRIDTFSIRRTFSSESELVSADFVATNEADLRRLFDLPEGVYTDVAVAVANPSEVGTVAAKIAATFPDARIVSRAQLQRTYEAIFDWREGMMLVLLAGSVLAFVVLAWEKASGLSAEERRELGVLKAVGWETGDVIRMKLWEGLVVSLGASLLGYLAAWAHVFVLGAPVFAAALKGWSVLYPEFPLAAEVDGLEVLTLFALTVLPYLAATIAPVWRAATIDPDVVMR